MAGAEVCRMEIAQQPSSSEGRQVSEVRTAMVGLGWWGRKMTDLIQSKGRQLTLVRAVDPSADARAFAAAKGLASSDRYEDILSDPDVEAVILATPHSLHAEQIERAVAAGKHVFCEKPLALTKAGAREGGRRLRCRQPRSGHGPRTALRTAGRRDARRLRRTASLGRLLQVEANFSHDKFLSLDASNWRLNPDRGAGRRHDGHRHPSDRPVRVKLFGAGQRMCACLREPRLRHPPGRHDERAHPLQAAAAPPISRRRWRRRSSRASPCSEPRAGSTSATRRMSRMPGRLGGDVAPTTGTPITVNEVPPAEPVHDNLVAFARAVRGDGSLPDHRRRARQQHRHPRSHHRIRGARSARSVTSCRVEEQHESACIRKTRQADHRRHAGAEDQRHGSAGQDQHHRHLPFRL